MKIVFWGTYDKGKPRNRILLKGLQQNGIEIIECHSNIWEGIEDKWEIQNWKKQVTFALKILATYPWLIFKYLITPKHDAVFIGYMGHLDTIIIWPFAKLRGVPIVWDAFLSLYNTIVEDRKLFKKTNPLSILIYLWERTACNTAKIVILDTKAHIKYFCKKYRLSQEKFHRIFVGAENEVFFPKRDLNISVRKKNLLNILFYGQFIPLHGIEHIITAARILKSENIKFTLIGRGQEEHNIREILIKDPLPNIDWIPWVPYKDLLKRIHEADICLGIFGDTQKSSQVIPNKVFQIIASEKPLITRDSPAIRELLTPEIPGIRLVPPGQPAALAEAIISLSKEIQPDIRYPEHIKLSETFSPKTIGAELIRLVEIIKKR